ncbi:DUF91 domain-containing protein [Methanoplanus sp. FWC-SCC4]|uniref:DUF91 domain-containing protein n=1 Tax=Methanochimaera problematica TaxID=2609417 RepID=A0AA97FD48_9EURY|nr:endonuclease NucS domain-containing protein [Methanoplanus sp. FWC-SCC4]WOF16023.1 DUF91 domain-containing protein [Methanoplanus sp. FWC-SCC4]
MPIEVGLWNITSNNISKIEYSSIDSEKRLEDVLSSNISILDDNLLIIGRQTPTIFGKYIDLLGIDPEGKITIVELKKNKTSREVISQVLDYASWIKDLSYDEIKNICKDYRKEDFESLFAQKFGISPPEKINQEHDMIIVCSELDNETERILNYLSNNYSVPINAVFFRFFSDSNSEYLSRSWLIDPIEAEEKICKSGIQNKGETWNGKDFVVNIDSYDGISIWEDAQKYGYITAGGGAWHIKSLKNLFVGARIFAMIPKKGYVGVGKVIAESIPIKDFKINKGDKEVSILDIPLKCEGIKKNSENLEICTYLVRVEWLRKNQENMAYWETGLRGNQNSAFKLKNKFTLDKLIKHFKLED